MKLQLQPTTTIEQVNGVPARVWEGVTDKGVPVKAWIASVQPQTHDAEKLAAFDKELREVKGERQLVSYDLRLFVD